MALALVPWPVPGADAEEAGLGVDGVEPTVVAEAHPGDVVADGLGLPARQGRLKHGEVGLAAGAGEGGGDVVGAALGRRQLQDQHVLGQPALVAGHHRGDAQGVALLAQQGVAAVARAVRPDLPVLGEVDDVLDVVAWPGAVGVTRRQGLAHRVHGRNEEAVVAELAQRILAHPGHDPHGHGDVGAVGDLDAQCADARAQRAHAERHHVHGAPAHRAGEQTLKVGPHLVGVEPVVGGAGVGRILGADEGAALDPGDVLGIGGGIEGIRMLDRVQAAHGAGVHQQVGQRRPLVVRTIAPVHAVRLRQGGDLAHPGDQSFVLGRGGFETLSGGYAVSSTVGHRLDHRVFLARCGQPLQGLFLDSRTRLRNESFNRSEHELSRL